MEQQFIFRQITSHADLDTAFRQRYSVYAHSRMYSFLKQSDDQIDIDSYDLHASHYGFFCNDVLVGYVRIVQNRDLYLNTAVAAFCEDAGLLRDYPECKKLRTNSNSPVYPFLSYPGAPEPVATYYEAHKNKVIVEIGRMILIPEFRNNRAIVTLIECAGVAAMHAIGSGEGVAIINCFCSHERVYHLFGFQRLPGLKEFDSYNFNLKGVALAMRLSTSMQLTDVPQRLRMHIDKLSSLYARNPIFSLTL